MHTVLPVHEHEQEQDHGYAHGYVYAYAYGSSDVSGGAYSGPRTARGHGGDHGDISVPWG